MAKTSMSRRALNFVEDVLGDRFKILGKLEEGGTGLIYKAHREGDPERLVAVKFYAPPSQRALFQKTTIRQLVQPVNDELFDAEIRFLKSVRHPGIQEVVSWGTLDNAVNFLRSDDGAPLVAENESVRFLVSRFIDGRPLLDWISHLATSAKDQWSRDLARQSVLRCILDLMDVLVFLHEVKQYQHSDLRSENILVHEPACAPILIDFAYAHCFDLELSRSQSKTHIKYFPDNAPDSLIAELHSLMAAEGSNSVDRKKLRDLIFPGLDLYHLGQLFRQILEMPEIGTILTTFDRGLLSLVTHRLTNWTSVRRAQTSEYRDQLAKLGPGYWGEFVRAVPSGGVGRVKHIALPRSSVLLSELIERILETQAFRRLQLLNQLSLLSLVYPGATQTRFEHSLSVYVTATELIESLKRSPRFCLLFDQRKVSHFLLAALLHDVNHFPFLHYFQEIGIAGGNGLDLVDLFCNGEATQDSPSLYELVAEADLEPALLKSIVFGDFEKIEGSADQVIKSSIDSGLDIDKMTYVYEDSLTTGVPFGRGVDRRTLIECADIVRIKKTYHLCFRSEAISAVESLLFARYWNFTRIYWHHTNRAIVAMLSHTLRKLIPKIGVEEYLRATIRSGEVGAVRFLDDKFEQFFHRRSLLHDITSRRDGIYKRLFSIRVSWSGKGEREEAARKLCQRLRLLDQGTRERFVGVLSRSVGDFFRGQLRRSIGEDDLLLDIPGRPLENEVGEIHICTLKDDGSAERIVVSPFISQLTSEFQELSQTIRFFIAPDLRNMIGRERIEGCRSEIGELVRDALDDTAGGGSGQFR